MYFYTEMISPGVYTTKDAFYLTDTYIANTECYQCSLIAFDITAQLTVVSNTTFKNLNQDMFTNNTYIATQSLFWFHLNYPYVDSNGVSVTEQVIMNSSVTI